MRFRDVLYLVNASLRCLLHIEANIFMRDSFSCYSGGAGVLFNASSEQLGDIHFCFLSKLAYNSKILSKFAIAYKSFAC